MIPDSRVCATYFSRINVHCELRPKNMCMDGELPRRRTIYNRMGFFFCFGREEGAAVPARCVGRRDEMLDFLSEFCFGGSGVMSPDSWSKLGRIACKKWAE